MAELHELLAYPRLKIWQDAAAFKFSLDSLLLAGFIEAGENTKRIIDLGCGNAPIPLYLSLKTAAPIIGVELQKPIAELAERSVAENGLGEQIKILNADLKGIHKTVGANRFDIVIANPPYFPVRPGQLQNDSPQKVLARHEVAVTLAEIVATARALATDGGAFYLVHRAERLVEICALLTEGGFGISKLQFVYTKPLAKSATIVLLCARSNRTPQLKVLPPLHIYDACGDYTAAIKKIFYYGQTEREKKEV